MASIPVGLKGEHRRLVTSEIAIDFLGLEGARVLGTPFMIMLLEMTARNSIVPILEAGYDSVGAEGNVRHLAATAVGMEGIVRTGVIGGDHRRGIVLIRGVRGA